MIGAENISNKFEVVLDHRCLLGEGPVWDDENKKILWLDILAGEIHQFSHLRNEHEWMCVGQAIGAIALTTSGRLVAAVKNGFAMIDPASNSIKLLGNPEEGRLDNRFNDGKCDPSGNFWAGTMDHINARKGAGSLFVLHKDLSVSIKITQVSCSNGMAWSPDHTTFYYIDTPTSQIVSYDYNLKDGAIANKEVVITIPVEEGWPDGMTIDNQGMLWIAHWGGWKVSVWNPATGQLIKNLLLPVSQITSCTFGGDNLEDLYITSAKTGLTERELLEQPLAGCLFVIRKCGHKGQLPYKFHC